LAEAVRPPYRPEPGRGRGRPPNLTDDDEITGPPPPLPPLTPIERRAFDYSALERCMAQLDLSIRQTKRALDRVARGAPAGDGPAPVADDEAAADPPPGPGIDIDDDRNHQGLLP